MYTEEQLKALEQFDQLAQKLGSQNKACDMVGIKAAIMTPLKKGSYPGNADAQFAKLTAYFRTKEEAAELPSGSAMRDYKPTSISKKIYEDIRNCQLKGGLAISCGDSGIGKTMAAQQFVKDHPNDTIYIALNPCLTTIRAILKILCARMNISEKTIDEMWIALASKLRDGMVIIIDEAQHCPVRSLEALRALSDYFYDANQTLGIIFIGNPETARNFGGKKKEEYEQLSNRRKNTSIYRTQNIRREDIQLIFPDLRDNEPEIDFLFAVSHGEPGIRGTIYLYNQALDNENITYEGLIAMAKKMGIRV